VHYNIINVIVTQTNLSCAIFEVVNYFVRLVYKSSTN